MKKDKYNGWANRETWLVSLWLNNDESMYELAKEHAKEGADNLKNLIQGVKEDHSESEGMFSDLLNQSLARVDWQSVADGLCEQ